jgi:hypothetical protein
MLQNGMKITRLTRLSKSRPFDPPKMGQCIS